MSKLSHCLAKIGDTTSVLIAEVLYSQQARQITVSNIFITLHRLAIGRNGSPDITHPLQKPCVHDHCVWISILAHRQRLNDCQCMGILALPKIDVGQAQLQSDAPAVILQCMTRGLFSLFITQQLNQQFDQLLSQCFILWRDAHSISQRLDGSIIGMGHNCRSSAILFNSSRHSIV